MPENKTGVSVIIRSQVFPVLVFSRKPLDGNPVEPFNKVILFINSFSNLINTKIPDIKFTVMQLTQFPKTEMHTRENEGLLDAYLRSSKDE